MSKLNSKYNLSIFAFFIIFCLSSLTSTVYAEKIYPDDENWIPDIREGATAEITGANPRSGNGSLALSTDGSVYDWAFYYRYAGDDVNTDSWGLLSDINGLSFDWYRGSVGSENEYGSPWLAQTPVLRLLIRDNFYYSDTDYVTYFSELVWEKYYTDSGPAMTGEWASQDLLGQNFWRHIPDQGYTIFDGTIVQNFSPNPLLPGIVSEWAASGDISYPYSDEAVIYGISVGVGSNWPDYYNGNVDNIFLSFGEGGMALNDNFELRPVPEPGTLLLLGSGLFTLAVRRRRHFKR